MAKKKRNKILIILSIIVICLIITIAIVIIRKRSNISYIAPSIIEETPQTDEDESKVENNFASVEVNEFQIKTLDKKEYLQIELTNIIEEDIFNVPINIEFVNLDGDIIYNAGCIIDVLLKGMRSEFYVVVSDEIADMIEKDKIDHIIINGY